MDFERNLLISVLKMTKKGPALIKDVNTEAHLTSNICACLLQKMQKENLVILKDDEVNIEEKNRIKIAIKAATLGADLQVISNLLCWQEFEKISAETLKINGYTVYTNLHFKHDGHRYEIDVIGCRKPLVVCIDCKRWQHAITASALRKIVEDQSRRTMSLAKMLPDTKLRIDCTKWEKAKFVPAILSLMPGPYKFYYEVPIVPVFSLQDFICQLPLNVDNVKVYPKKFTTLTSDM